jgi:hypothetical protein
MFKKILKIFINKYFLITVAFVVWLGFFDSDSIVSRMGFHQKLNELKQEKKFYLDEIRKDSTLTVKLMNDSLALEKFAREKYLMKKDKEDVYLVIDTTADRYPR